MTILKTTLSFKNSLPGASLSLALAQFAAQQKCPLLILGADMPIIQRLQREIRFFSPDLPLIMFPDWETLPYDRLSPHADIISQRLQTLQQLPLLQEGIIFAPIHTCLQRLPPIDFIAGRCFNLSVKQKINREALRDHCVKQGYRVVHQVVQHGELAVRGSIIDIFPMGFSSPLRIDWFDDEIEQLRLFDPETQLSTKKLEKFLLLPAKEFPLDEQGVRQFRQKWRSEFPGNSQDCPLYCAISEGLSPPGIEYYLPLFFEETSNFLDYLPTETLIIEINVLEESINKYIQLIEERYEQYRHNLQHPLIHPEKLFFSHEQIKNKQQPFKVFRANSAPSTCGSFLLMQGKNTVLNDWLAHSEHRTLFCAETLGHREALQKQLNAQGIYPALFENWTDFLNASVPHGLIIASLDEGAFFLEDQLALLTETELLGQPVMQRRLRKSTDKSTQSIIRQLNELKVSDAVVHIDHGVGRYCGLELLQSGGVLAEYLTLEYANQNKLYVPVANLHCLSRYGGLESEHAPLHSLGTEQWQKAREKAAKRAHDVAAELLALHATRASRPGFAFKIDESYQQFESAFPFETTPDQQKAISHVLEDMCSAKSMDRLICGDVGFGKTEVAMRAAFVATHNGKQVAVLAPTTLLVQQHEETFKNRFANTGLIIETFSRFNTEKAQADIVKKLAEGKVDIIIGTHKLLQPEIHFKNLGLVIIDEEHRFGVKQKERFKTLRAEVDLLTLTATPIPRTLNMAMNSVRDLSIIATPPAKRLAIKTFVHEFQWDLIREAIMRELSRGGQIYYLHNHVDTIEQRKRELAECVPQARVVVGHGQMPAAQLEKVMTDFYHQRFNILICTTIIETGIDIPNANTILIERADKFGLSQLHQLRGRVGRSHHQAYAYMLIPPKSLISADAEKRLDAITQFEDLGIGFSLAMQDLEIRGAGEFLGNEQSGQIQTVGLSLYLEFLERAVASIKEGKNLNYQDPLKKRTEIDLNLSALIPDSYLPDIHTRLLLYKRLSEAQSLESLDSLQVEMIDRFGLLPPATEQLFANAALRLQAEALGILKITCTKEYARLEFSEKNKIEPLKLIRLIQAAPANYQLESSHKLKIHWPGTLPQERYGKIETLLKAIT